MTDAQREARSTAELRAGRATTTEGQVVGVDFGTRLVEVNLGGFTQRMPWKGPPPWEGDRVRIDSSGDYAVCQLIEGAPYGTVAQLSGQMLVVTGDDGETYVYPFLSSTSFSVGNRVAMDHGRRLVLGILSTDPVFAPVIDVPGAPPGGARSAWFTPAWSGNWSGGNYSNEWVTISSTRVGAYGYGTQIRDTIDDAAIVTLAQLHLVQNWDNVPGTPSSMGTHAFDGRPGSGFDNADLGGSYAVGGGGGIVDIRGVVISELQTGAKFGIGFRSGSDGWREYDRAPASGRIYVEWRV